MTLLVAVADAAADQELVASARALAAAARWEVRGVHVREPGIQEPGSADLEGLELTAIDGDPVEALIRLAGGAAVDAFAFGLSCACGPGPAAGMGHVAEALLNSHVAPVLLVRPDMRPVAGLKRLYVPLEGSPSTSAAMRAADDALCARGREIVMLHVVTGDTPAETGSLPAPRMTDQEHYEWSAWQDEFTMRFSTCPEGGRHRVARPRRRAGRHHRRGGRQERRRAHRAVVERELRERPRRRDQGAPEHGALPAPPRARATCRRPTPADAARPRRRGVRRP